MDLGLKNKRVLITGASKGIGASIANSFLKEDSKVTLVARDEKKLISLLSGFTKENDYISADLRQASSPSKVAKEVVSRHKTIDIIIHNVGGALGIKNPFSPVKDWMEVWSFNLGIAIEINNVIAPLMKKNKRGRIIHVSSISAELGEPKEEPFGGALPYATAKASLNAYVKGLARELAEKNVIVTALMPGAVLSEGKYWDKLQKKDPSLVKDFLKQYYPVNRLGKPEEIASFALFLASEQASFASGSIVSISGGRI